MLTLMFLSCLDYDKNDYVGVQYVDIYVDPQ